MSTLHTVNKSPFEKTSLVTCLSYATPGSAVLLIEDGVYGALAGTVFEGPVKAALGNVKVYCLGPDLAARGFGEDRVIPGIGIVDYASFVDLAAENAKVQAWL